MFGWTFAARTADELSRLIRSMGKHRYALEVDLRLHWVIDRALSQFDEQFALEVQRFKATRNLAGDMDIGSRDPRLWRSASPELVGLVLDIFWTPDDRASAARTSLQFEMRAAGFGADLREPFAGDAEEPPHPELVKLDWSFLPVDRLDTERHKGALLAMEDSGDEVEPSEPVFVEGPTLAEAELCLGAPRGVLPCDPTFWADGPYSYADYVFRGVRKAAKLVDPPVGYRDIDKD